MKYNKIIERYKQYLISISFDTEVAWFGLNKYIGEYSFMSMDEDNVHIFKPKILCFTQGPVPFLWFFIDITITVDI